MCGECTPSCHSPGDSPRLRIAVLGVCGSGKTTLARSLRDLGFDARQISQEHSGVRRLWRRTFMPDFLVYLEASPGTVRNRLGVFPYGDTYNRQVARLALAREEADMVVATDDLSVEQVLQTVVDALLHGSAD